MPAATKPSSSKTREPEKLGGISSEAVAKATGKTWPEWIAFLDSLDAIKLPHKEIAALLYDKYKVRGWWCQMVTVGYEQAKGRRVVGQTCAGDYSANASKTLPLSARAAHAWLADDKKRTRWLDQSITLRTATAPKSARLQFPDGSIAGIWVTPKGDAKCSLGVSHDKLPDAKTAAKHKAFWAEALSRLAEAVK
jgi:hypothetical protein